MKKICGICVGILLSLCISTTAFAGEKIDTPLSLDEVQMIDTAKAKNLIDSGNVLVVDPRKKIEFMEAHLPGAISVVYREKSDKVVNFDMSKDTFKLEEAVPSKDKELLFYCNGIKCWKSYKAARMAKELGYKSVYWYRDGIPAWKEAGHSVE